MEGIKAKIIAHFEGLKAEAVKIKDGTDCRYKQSHVYLDAVIFSMDEAIRTINELIK